MSTATAAPPSPDRVIEAGIALRMATATLLANPSSSSHLGIVQGHLLRYREIRHNHVPRNDAHETAANEAINKALALQQGPNAIRLIKVLKDRLKKIEDPATPEQDVKDLITGSLAEIEDIIRRTTLTA